MARKKKKTITFRSILTLKFYIAAACTALGRRQMPERTNRYDYNSDVTYRNALRRGCDLGDPIGCQVLGFDSGLRESDEAESKARLDRACELELACCFP